MLNTSIAEPASKLAIGTAQFGMDYGIANQNGQVAQDEVTAILHLAWNSGINMLDTAKVYGNSEEVIGISLADHGESGWNITTKVSDIQSPLSDQLRDSAEKLTVTPFTVLAHSAELFLEEKFKEELIFIREENLVSKIGVSLYSEEEIIQVMASELIPDIIQLPINVLDTRLYRRGNLGMLKEKGIEIYARSAFLQGLFFLERPLLINRFPEVVPALEKLKSIASEAGLTPAELSLLWLASLEEVDKVVLGIDNVVQLKTHLRTLEKIVDANVFEKALCLCYENENVLNPSLWP